MTKDLITAAQRAIVRTQHNDDAACDDADLVAAATRHDASAVAETIAKALRVASLPAPVSVLVRKFNAE